jgi:hypothetical protein
MENFKEMYGRDPFRNTYWDDKRAKLENKDPNLHR